MAVAEPPLGLRPLRETLITGYLAKLARESVRGGCSQERLARVMGVSPDTVAGWETGRRPLAAMRAGQFVRLKPQLARLDASRSSSSCSGSPWTPTRSSITPCGRRVGTSRATSTRSAPASTVAR